MATTFDEACGAIEPLLTGSTRADIVAAAAEADTFESSLVELRDAMRSHLWRAGDRSISLDPFVQDFDRRTRQEGFHVLHDWDGKIEKVNADIIPVDVLLYISHQRGSELPDRIALAILLDYYFLHILSLFALRIWDAGDADANLDRLNTLLSELQGAAGGGQQFVDDAETLILIATSHYELNEEGYRTLLARVRRLNPPHQTRIALSHAASLGCHLRFGFEATCGRDTVATRDDNVADYPWLCFALAALMKEYERTRSAAASGERNHAERNRIVEAMLNGLTPDARAFVGAPPSSLSECETERAEFRDGFRRCQTELLDAFEAYRPTERLYSPLNFFFNFSHNVLKGMVVDSLLWGEARAVTLNDLFWSARSAGPENDARLALAKTLMTYARNNPDRIRGRLMPVIVYDPGVGRQAFGVTMRKLRE
jgi:hypothetical protein